MSGKGMGWSGDGGVLTGGSSSSPQGGLLITNCVGCHSSTSADTIITVASSDIPIVYNISVPTTPLAGGNFHWVAKGDNTKGHNVYGIVGSDSLNTAPGRTLGGCTNSCHDSLADEPNSDNEYKAGCEGCHVFTAHHDDSKPWYRFLKGHGQPPFGPNAETFSDYVIGEKDDDWEADMSGHNYYKGTTAEYTEASALGSYNSITSFCQGCHGVFHGTPDQPVAGDGMGSAGAWIRHPTDIALPQGDGSEYSSYDPVSDYSMEAPVAWTDPTNESDKGTPVVMCLSCHRPHGSPYSDLLRWDYDGMEAGTTGATAGTGCFTCHTEKDGIL
jgi:hypothetical protein